MIKKSLNLIMTLVLVLLLSVVLGNNFKVNADEIEMEPLVTSNGTFVYYKNTTENVMLPKEYDYDTYMRSVWVTPLAGCIPSYKNADSYKKEIIEVFDVMDHFNLNSLIFHIRIMNDALYPSKLNPTSSYLNADWDVLEWVIDECHKRGFEFHAWLNPYRVKASGGSTAVEEAAKIARIQKDPVAAAENRLLLWNLNLMADYLRANREKLTTEQSTEIHADVKTFMTIRDRLSQNMRYNKVEVLKTEKFLDRITADLAGK